MASVDVGVFVYAFGTGTPKDARPLGESMKVKLTDRGRYLNW